MVEVADRFIDRQDKDRKTKADFDEGREVDRKTEMQSIA